VPSSELGSGFHTTCPSATGLFLISALMRLQMIVVRQIRLEKGKRAAIVQGNGETWRRSRLAQALPLCERSDNNDGKCQPNSSARDREGRGNRRRGQCGQLAKGGELPTLPTPLRLRLSAL
jgi:hypothetical protein